MTTTELEAPVDGRTARRDRNSEAVLDAVHDLFVTGNLMPSVEEVALRSGVSLRSIYRYFEDTEALYRAAIARQVASAEPLFVLEEVGEGSLDTRVQRLVDQRLVLHDKLGPTVRAALLRSVSAPLVQAQVQRRQEQLTRQVEQHFAPEVRAIGGARGKAVVACADALCQFEAVEHLRARRGLSVTRTRNTLVTGVLSLFGTD